MVECALGKSHPDLPTLSLTVTRTPPFQNPVPAPGVQSAQLFCISKNQIFKDESFTLLCNHILYPTGYALYKLDSLL